MKLSANDPVLRVIVGIFDISHFRMYLCSIISNKDNAKNVIITKNVKLFCKN